MYTVYVHAVTCSLVADQLCRVHTPCALCRHIVTIKGLQSMNIYQHLITNRGRGVLQELISLLLMLACTFSVSPESLDTGMLLP